MSINEERIHWYYNLVRQIKIANHWYISGS